MNYKLLICLSLSVICRSVIAQNCCCYTDIVMNFDNTKANRLAVNQSVPDSAKENNNSKNTTEKSSITMSNVTLSGVPQGLEVFMDGQFIGNLPSGQKISPGEHIFIFKAPGYENLKLKISFDTDSSQCIQMSLRPKTKTKAFMKSLLLPGWGQKYSDHSARAIIYPMLQIASIGGAFWANHKYNSAVDDYEPLQIDYLNAISEYEIKNAWTIMQNKYDDIDNWEKKRNIMIGAAVGLWLWNACDAFLFGPETAKSDQAYGAVIKPNMRYVSENGETMFELDIRF